MLVKHEAKEYKDGRVKDNAWQLVAKQMNWSVSECERKWKLLRD